MQVLAGNPKTMGRNLVFAQTQLNELVVLPNASAFYSFLNVEFTYSPQSDFVLNG